MKKIFIFFSLIIVFSASLYAKPVIGFRTVIDSESAEKYGAESDEEVSIIVFNSIIDWNEQKVKVSAKTKIVFSSEEGGTQIKNQYTVLKTLALKRAVEIIDTINIDCIYTIKDMKKISSDFTAKFNSFVTDVSVYDLDRSYKDTSVLECSLTIPIAGTYSLTKFMTDNYMPYYFNFIFPVFPDFLSTKLYAAEATGIIIDARDIDINPALLPKVTSEKKKDVYNPKNVNKKDLAEKGAVQYAVVGKKVDEKIIKEEAAKQEVAALKRTGNNPVVIKAYKVDGPLQTDAIITEKDAKILQGSKALKEGKVTIIVDSRIGGTIGKTIGDYEILALVNGE